MNRRHWIGLAALAVAHGRRTEGQPLLPPPPGFKILVGAFGIKPDPISTEEIIARQGRAYQFRSGTTEVVLIDPARKRVELIDLTRKVQAEVAFEGLDQAVARVGAKLAAEIARREQTGTRADAIEAGMTRDLAEPKFRESAGPGARRVRLANPTVVVDADGDPDPDPARLALILLSLDLIAKLGAFVTPDDLPPFAELAAIAALRSRNLRPTELSYLYRLAGPPNRIRRTYRLVPDLTVREREAVVRVDRVRDGAPMLRYERYREPR